jgi:hypothetical protein
MASVQGLNKILSALEHEKTKAPREIRVVVGYTAAYAVYVHENTQMFHRVGQAKFLEQPARDMQAELTKTVEDYSKKGATLAQALYVAGLKLQRASQKLVPVDTGALKASAFTRVE